jgi:hypothetical protein
MDHLLLQHKVEYLEQKEEEKRLLLHTQATSISTAVETHNKRKKE